MCTISLARTLCTMHTSPIPADALQRPGTGIQAMGALIEFDREAFQAARVTEARAANAADKLAKQAAGRAVSDAERDFLDAADHPGAAFAAERLQAHATALAAIVAHIANEPDFVLSGSTRLNAKERAEMVDYVAEAVTEAMTPEAARLLTTALRWECL